MDVRVSPITGELSLPVFVYARVYIIRTSIGISKQCTCARFILMSKYLVHMVITDPVYQKLYFKIYFEKYLNINMLRIMFKYFIF
jgi:hypothetical protein